MLTCICMSCVNRKRCDPLLRFDIHCRVRDEIISLKNAMKQSLQLGVRIPNRLSNDAFELKCFKLNTSPHQDKKSYEIKFIMAFSVQKRNYFVFYYYFTIWLSSNRSERIPIPLRYHCKRRPTNCICTISQSCLSFQQLLHDAQLMVAKYAENVKLPYKNPTNADSWPSILSSKLIQLKEKSPISSSNLNEEGIYTHMQ